MSPPTREEILARLDENALLLEPREFFDSALVDATDDPRDHWPRQTRMVVAVYDREKCLDAIMAWLGCDDEAALDWLRCNTEGAWQGEGTPTFRGMDPYDDEEAEVN